MGQKNNNGGTWRCPTTGSGNGSLQPAAQYTHPIFDHDNYSRAKTALLNSLQPKRCSLCLTPYPGFATNTDLVRKILWEVPKQVAKPTQSWHSGTTTVFP